MNLAIIIPVFNEEKSIEEVLKKVSSKNIVKEIIVVNDASTDRTPVIIEKVARENKKIKFYNHPENRGKGQAIITALNHVTQNYFLIQDADLEYDPNEYDNLIKHIKENTVVYGSRLITKNKYAYSRTLLGNLVLTNLTNLLFQTKLTDSYTCYKLLPTKIIKTLNLSSQGFEIEAEITCKLAKKHIEILEVPINYIPRKYEDGKKIKALDALKGIFTILKIYFLY